MRDVTTFILDEVHEHSEDRNDLVLALRRRVHSNVHSDQRLILMSATGDRSSWARYFWTMSRTTDEQLPLEDDCFHTIHVPEGAATFARDIFHANRWSVNVPEDAASVAADFLSSTEFGNVLVFVSGVDLITLTVQALQVALGNDGVQIVPLHAQQPARERRAALSVGPQRKVIVATNVAESGLTIPNVAAVIDCGLYKQPWVDEVTGTYALVPSMVSRSAAVQRAGRTGRTCDGVVFRLYPVEDLERAPLFPVSSIVSDDAADMLLHSAFAYGSAQTVMESLEPPSFVRFERALRRLVEVGAVTRDGRWNDHHPVAPPKLVFIDSKVGFRIGSILMGGIRYDCLPDVIVIVALLHGE